VTRTAKPRIHHLLNAEGMTMRGLAFLGIFPRGLGLFFEFALGALDSILPKPCAAWDNG
jgi:hypothetical protein